MASKQSAPQTQTTTMEPPKYLQPYLQNVASEASNLYSNNNIPQQRLAGFSPETEQALQLQAQRATSGSPVNLAARNQALSTINGDYMSSPQFMQQFQAASNKINPQVDSLFARAGRSGSGLADSAKTEALGNAFAGLLGQERQNQLAMTQFAPQLAQQDYYDINQLAGVGAQRENLQNDQYALDYQNGMNPWNELSMYSGILQGLNTGGTTTQSTPMYRNRMAGGVGGALAGGQVFGVPGAIAGGLLGAM